MKHWTVEEIQTYLKVTARKARAIYDAWQCEDYTVRKLA